jgi:hypothetical protein
MDNVNTFPFWRAISKSRRSANRVLSSQPRIYRLAFKNEDSEDALATNRSKASIPNANSREAILNLYLGSGQATRIAGP